MASVTFANLYFTEISAPVAPTDTTIQVADVTKIVGLIVGGNFMFLTLIDAASWNNNLIPPAKSEIVKVTAITGSVAPFTLTVVRAQDGTTAQSFDRCDIAANLFNAGSISGSQGSQGVQGAQGPQGGQGAQGSGGSGKYVISCTFNGTFSASTVFVRHPFPIAVTFPVGLTNSKGFLDVSTPVTATMSVDLQRSTNAGLTYSSVGTMRFLVFPTSTGYTADFIFITQTTFNIGDLLRVVSPASPDATAGNIGFSLIGTV
jgi:hypothetical protein